MNMKLMIQIIMEMVSELLMISESNIVNDSQTSFNSKLEPVIVRRNMDIDAGWVNGTLAVVIALYQNCVVIQQMSNPSQRIPVPRFRQRIEINSASYSILHHQFPLQLAYAVTVHRIQGLTVQKSIVCLNSKILLRGKHMWL